MAEDSYGLVVEVALNNSNFQDGMKNLNRTIRGATAEFKNSIAGLDNYGKGLDGLKAKSDMLSKQVNAQTKIVQMNREKFNESRTTLDNTVKAQENLKSKLNEVERAYKDNIKTTGENSRETKALKDELDKLSVEYSDNEEKIRNNVRTMENWESKVNNAEARLKNMERSLRDTNKEIDLQSSSWHKLSQKLETAGTKMKAMGEKLKTVGKNLTTKLTLPIVGVGTAAAKMGTDFNETMANIATMIPGENERLQQLKGDIQDVSITVAKSTDEIASGTYGVISAFGDAADTIEKVEINAKAARAGLATTDDALNLSSAIMKGFGDTTAESNKRVMDLAFETLRLGQTSFPELASSMGKVVPTTNELGISQEELFAVFATSTGVTGNASEVSTQYQGALKALMAPTKDMAKLMSELGYENGKAMIKQKGLIGSIETIVKKADESGQPLQKYIGSIQGQVLALALAGEQSDTYRDKLSQLMDSQGALDQAFEEQTEGINATGFSFEQSMAKMRVAAQKFGDAMGTMLAKGAELLSLMADKLNKLTPQQQQMILQIAALIAAIGPATLIFGKLASVIGSIVGAISTISGAIAVVTTGATAATPAIAGLVKVITVLSGPIGIAVGSLVALTAGGIALYKHLKQDAIPAVELFGEEVSDSTKGAVGGFLELEKEATLALNKMNWTGQEVTEETRKNIVDTFSEMKNQVVTELEEQKEGALESLGSMFGSMKGMAEEEKAEALRIIEEKYNDQIEKVEESNEKIAEILEKAKEEKRELNDTEKREINEIKEDMKKDAIRILSDSEAEQMAIMERLKQESEKISLLQLAETTKRSAEQRDKTIEDAEKEYNERLKYAAQLRADGSEESNKLADTVISAAERQYKKAVSYAEDMHEDIIKEVELQAGEHVNLIDLQTGEIKTRWRMLKEKVLEYHRERNKKAKEAEEKHKENMEKLWNGMKKAVSEKTAEMKETAINRWNEITEFYSSLPNRFREKGKEIMQGLADGIKEKAMAPINAAKDAASRVAEGFKKFFRISSPSKLFMEYGGDLMEGLAEGIKDNLDMVEYAMDLATKTINEAGIEEGIRRLSIATDDYNKKLLNQSAIVEMQKRYIEQLSKEHDKLKNSNKASTEEIDKAKKALERAKTELLRYERAVDETTKKIVENFRKQREEVEKSQIDAINDLTSRIKSALKKRYEEEYRAKEKAINREIDSLDRWKNESLERINAVYDARKKRNDEELAELDRWRNRNIDSINAVYDTKMQRITETANAQIKALQDEIKALDKAEQQKSREEEDAERQRRIGRLREAIKYEHNEFNKAELQKELNKEIKDRDEQLRQWQVEDRKEKLNQQIADIRESAEHEKAILEQRRNEELERTNSIYEHKRATLEKEREMLNIRQKEELTRINELYEYERETLDRKLENYRAFLNRRTEDAKLQAEAEKMIMDNNQKEIVKLLHSYEDSYKRAGQSLGERLVEGFKPAIDQIIDMIDSINGRLGSAKASAGRSVNSIGAMASDGGDSGAKSQSVGSPQGGPVGSVWNDDGSLKGYMWKDGTITAPDGSGTIVNNNVTISSPKALSHSDIKRETETTLRRLSFSV